MSNSAHPPNATTTIGKPRAVIHKKILDAAESRPDASIKELANEVSGATAELVGNVLEEYGDPAEESGDDDDAAEAPGETQRDERPDDPTMSNAIQNTNSGFDQIDRAELTDKQRETLRAIRDNPDATQADLADLLGVSGATICTRVNTIPGFDWEQRQQFVKTMFENGDHASNDEREMEPIDDLSDQVADLESEVAALKQRLEDRHSESTSALTDPELVHKITHACLNSDEISKDEELRILQDLLA